VRLHADLKAAINEVLKTNNSFVHIIDKAVFYTELYKSKSNPDMKINSSVTPLRTGKCGNYIETYRWFHYLYLKPMFFNVLSKVAIIFSILIVVGEFMILFQYKLIIMFGDNPSSDYGRHFFNIISLMILFYMCHCTYYGLFDLKISSFYAIYSHQ
jgi:hypothetical protein